MECTLAALIACFSWSNFYIDSGLAVWDADLYFDEPRTTVIQHQWGTETTTINTRLSDHYNPHGIVSVGMAIPLKNASLSIEARHMSSLATSKDRGINSISIHARWYPFR